jgi:hypothetical protein
MRRHIHAFEDKVIANAHKQIMKNGEENNNKLDLTKVKEIKVDIDKLSPEQKKKQKGKDDKTKNKANAKN